MKRRDFIAGLLVSSAIAGAHAQQKAKVYRIAIVSAAWPVAEMTETGAPQYRIFLTELRHLGYVEGQNLSVLRFSGEGRTEYYPQLARELVQENPDAILAIGGGLIRNLKVATSSIPIVGVMVDPVGTGIVASISRPGGNITGVSVDPGLDLYAKQLELLHELLPRISTVGYLASRAAWEGPMGASVQTAARKLGISLVGPPLEGTINAAEIRRVVAAMVEASVDAVLVNDQPENHINARLILELAEKAQLPAMYTYRSYVVDGGLMAYGTDANQELRQAASAVDQILKGTKPGDIPIYQATKLTLIINLKTAKALGIEIPLSLLARADEMIE